MSRSHSGSSIYSDNSWNNSDFPKLTPNAINSIIFDTNNNQHEITNMIVEISDIVMTATTQGIQPSHARNSDFKACIIRDGSNDTTNAFMYLNRETVPPHITQLLYERERRQTTTPRIDDNVIMIDGSDEEEGPVVFTVQIKGYITSETNYSRKQVCPSLPLSSPSDNSPQRRSYFLCLTELIYLNVSSHSKFQSIRNQNILNNQIHGIGDNSSSSTGRNHFQGSAVSAEQNEPTTLATASENISSTHTSSAAAIQNQSNSPLFPSLPHRNTTRHKCDPKHSQKSMPCTITAGKIMDFLETKLPYLTDEDLAGLSMVPPFVEALDQNKKQILEVVSKKFYYYESMKNGGNDVSSSSSSATTRLPTSDTNETTMPDVSHTMYQTTLGEFASSQFKRQNSSLVNNAGREDLMQSQRLIANHESVLRTALQHAELQSVDGGALPLTSELICQWHKELGSGNGGDGNAVLIENAGTYRIKPVRAGQSLFAPHTQVVSLMDNLFKALNNLEMRLCGNMFANPDCVDQQLVAACQKEIIYKQKVYGPITFAAIALFSILDIHPFVDGNGRLGRIVANWVLRRFTSLPFVINFFATPIQRREYMNAIQTTRLNTRLVLRRHGKDSNDTTININMNDMLLLTVTQSLGVFQPLVRLLMDRIHKSTIEFQKLLLEKQNLEVKSQEELDEQAAKRHRERAAAGTCLICFDDKPNFATLCCGKAVHLNCIAEWLSNKTTCPQCRAELPALPRKERRGRSNSSTTDFTGAIERATDRAGVALQAAYARNVDLSITETTTGSFLDMDSDDDDSTSTADNHPNDHDDTTTIITTMQPGDMMRNTHNRVENITHDSATTIGNDNRYPLGGIMHHQFTAPTYNTNNDTLIDDADYNDTSTTAPVFNSAGFTNPTIMRPIIENNDDNDDTCSTTEEHSIVNSTTDDNDDSNQTTDPQPQQQMYQFCNNTASCRNKAALDCTNEMCGRCCILYSIYSCERHGT